MNRKAAGAHWSWTRAADQPSKNRRAQYDRQNDEASKTILSSPDAQPLPDQLGAKIHGASDTREPDRRKRTCRAH